jgi:hypothetical protein
MTGTCAACLHTNQSRSYLNHLVFNGWIWPTNKTLRGIHMGCMITELGSVPRGGIHAPAPRVMLEDMQPSVQWVPEAL